MGFGVFLAKVLKAVTFGKKDYVEKKCCVSARTAASAMKLLRGISAMRPTASMTDSNGKSRNT